MIDREKEELLTPKFSRATDFRSVSLAVLGDTWDRMASVASRSSHLSAAESDGHPKKQSNDSLPHKTCRRSSSADHSSTTPMPVGGRSAVTEGVRNLNQT